MSSCIAMIASEAIPFAKTGGLADVMGALPPALARAGHHVVVFLPFYRAIDARRHGITPTGRSVMVRSKGRVQTASIHTAPMGGATCYFIQHDGYFGRPELYQDRTGDYHDNAQRFAFFARAAIEAILAMGLKPRVIHAHDWQGAMALYHAQTHFAGNPTIATARRILTIHNIGYQGLFSRAVLADIGLDESDFAIDRVEFYGGISFLKAGITAADIVTTVSKTHAREILTAEYGFGLEGVLATKKDSLRGIVNGLDTAVWNPADDPHIPRTFSLKNTRGKGVCKARLQEELGLPVSASTPLIGMVGRLTVQKGIDLLHRALAAIMREDVQLALLGSGERNYHELLSSAAAGYPLAMRLNLRFDDALAHRIEAGADFFLMPSLYEPCGLNQMISMRYGTIPIVRATGGLADTVTTFDPQTWKGTGFSFAAPTAAALIRCVREALDIWRQPVLRNKLIKNAMAEDFSWTRIAEEYASLYRR